MTYQRLKKIMYDVGLEVYDRYSGRGMYSQQCIGFTSSDAIKDCVLLALEMEKMGEDALSVFGQVRTNNLGRDTIVYFPYIQWSEEEEETEAHSSAPPPGRRLREP